MDTEKIREEIKKEIQLELKKLKDFSDFVKQYPLGEDVEKRIVDERLDKINELREKLKNL